MAAERNTDTLCYKIPEFTTLWQYLYMNPDNYVPYIRNGEEIHVYMDDNGLLTYVSKDDPDGTPHGLRMSVPLMCDIVQQLKKRPASYSKLANNYWMEIRSIIVPELTMQMANFTPTK